MKLPQKQHINHDADGVFRSAKIFCFVSSNQSDGLQTASMLTFFWPQSGWDFYP